MCNFAIISLPIKLKSKFEGNKFSSQIVSSTQVANDSLCLHIMSSATIIAHPFLKLSNNDFVLCKEKWMSEGDRSNWLPTLKARCATQNLMLLIWKWACCRNKIDRSPKWPMRNQINIKSQFIVHTTWYVSWKWSNFAYHSTFRPSIRPPARIGIMTLSRSPYSELDKMSLFQDLKLKRRKVDSRCSSDGESLADTNASSPDLLVPLSPKALCDGGSVQQLHNQQALDINRSSVSPGVLDDDFTGGSHLHSNNSSPQPSANGEFRLILWLAASFSLAESGFCFSLKSACCWPNFVLIRSMHVHLLLLFPQLLIKSWEHYHKSTIIRQTV